MWLFMVFAFVFGATGHPQDITSGLDMIGTSNHPRIANDIKYTDLVNTSNITLKFATYCITPNSEPGFCVEISKCHLFAGREITPKDEAYDFIVASNCTPNNAAQMKLCCGSKDNFDAQIPKQQNNSDDDSDDVDPLPEDCGQQTLLTFSKRILGGTEAAIGEFPWMARIIHRNKYGTRNYGCSAFLVHRLFVMTAAHCVSDSMTKGLGPIFQINLGDHNTTSPIDCADHAKTKCTDPPQIIKAGEPVVYSGYNNLNGATFNNDIALIPLKTPAKFTNYVRPICLREKKSTHNLFTIAGWGKTETDDDSAVKKKVDVDRVELDTCENKYKEIAVRLNKRNQLCAGGKLGKDSCSGDSGGPLMVDEDFKWYAEGIVSFGYGCGRDGWPGVYTNIPRYVEWVKKTINRKLERRKKVQAKKPKRPKH